MSMYQVSFHDKQGNKRFGIVQSFHEQAEEFDAIGKKVVDDYITAEQGVIDTNRLTEVKMSFGKMDKDSGVWWGGDELHDYAALEQLAAEIRDERNPEGIHKNTLFMVGVGDGYASYVVTSVARTMCEIEWRGFCPDRWVARPWGYGGKFRQADIKRMGAGIKSGLPKRFGTNDTNEKITHFQRLYADYLQRFGEIPVGMEDILEID